MCAKMEKADIPTFEFAYKEEMYNVEKNNCAYQSLLLIHQTKERKFKQIISLEKFI